MKAKIQSASRAPISSARRRGALFRYGLALLSVALALGAGLLAWHYGIRRDQVTMLAFAIAVAAWYGGGAAASLAVICSCLACAYFFMEPFYSFAITSDELALFALLLLFGTVIGWFGTVRRRAEEELGERARLLALTHDEERDLVKSYKLGVNAYVVKPVEFHEFVNAVKKLGVFWAVINEPPPGSVRTK